MPIASAGSSARTTPNRQAVAELLRNVDRFCTAQEVHELLRQRGSSIGLTTVYRALQILADNDEVDVLRTLDGDVAYRSCSTGHHHHLVCRECGTTVEVEGPAVEKWATRVAADNGFLDVTHTIEIFGVCPACASSRTRGSTART